ncbi:MAG: arsenate reductase ArsC [Candidatus Omnitrophica bacterium]|nr:arsenate reductase ArsC [Candidatus Omnitrophota bacterium]MDD5575185.1 arsenate reductase ArsC [Candidatus Omnitrophota bacterium]
MDKKKVLFICVHNSARSQMAEAFLKTLAGDRFDVKSAGLEPGVLNPVAVAAMKEEGIDISRNETKGVMDLLRAGESFDYVITVCDASESARCPVFPGPARRMHWSFEDPSAVRGPYEEKLETARRVRDAIRQKVREWVAAI